MLEHAEWDKGQNPTAGRFGPPHLLLNILQRLLTPLWRQIRNIGVQLRLGSLWRFALAKQESHDLFTPFWRQIRNMGMQLRLGWS